MERLMGQKEGGDREGEKGGNEVKEGRREGGGRREKRNKTTYMKIKIFQRTNLQSIVFYYKGIINLTITTPTGSISSGKGSEICKDL